MTMPLFMEDMEEYAESIVNSRLDLPENISNALTIAPHLFGSTRRLISDFEKELALVHPQSITQ